MPQIGTVRLYLSMPIKFILSKPRGLNNPYKSTALLRDFRRFKGDVLLLQETHFEERNSLRLRDRRRLFISHSTASSKQRGFPIAMRDTVGFKPEKCVVDPLGQYILLICYIINILFTLVNAFVPNVGQTRFLTRLD